MRNAILFATTCFLAAACSSAATPEYPDTFSLSLSRTECYGFCPAYTITVDSTGELVFEGRSYVDALGKTRDTVTPETAQAAWDVLAEGDFWSLRENYASPDDVAECPEFWIDAPTARITATGDGEARTVVHYYGCQGNPDVERLSEMERRIDELLGSAEWIGDGA